MVWSLMKEKSGGSHGETGDVDISLHCVVADCSSAREMRSSFAAPCRGLAWPWKQ